MSAPEPTEGPVGCATELDLFMAFFSPGLEVRVRSRLSYTRADPYEVRLDCHVDSPAPEVWYLSRDLLRAGLRARAGEGGVRMRPGTGEAREFVFLTFGQGEERLVLRASARQFADFLAGTDRVVAPGDEHHHLDLDALLPPFGAEAPPFP